MRYLCELHCEKEQILGSFEALLFSMHQLNVEDNELIAHRLTELRTAADDLIKRYETLGTHLMLFADVMAIVKKENDTVVKACSLINERGGGKPKEVSSKVHFMEF